MTTNTFKQESAFKNLTLLLVGMLAFAGAGIWGFLVSGRGSELFAGAISGSGKIEAETRVLGGFDSIAIACPATIIVRQGEENLITVEADDNLLPQLVTEVWDGALAIENSEGNYFKRVVLTQTVKITIIVKDLKEIVLVRPARVEINGLETDQLALSLKGIGGTASVTIHVTKSLCVSLSGSSTVNYYGSPETIRESISGNASVNKLGD